MCVAVHGQSVAPCRATRERNRASQPAHVALRCNTPWLLRNMCQELAQGDLQALHNLAEIFSELCDILLQRDDEGEGQVSVCLYSYATMVKR
jgi:hypothetical protein